MGIRQVMVDDMDGSEGDVETFHLLGEHGEPLVIDLGPKNAEKFRKANRPFWDAARPDEPDVTPLRPRPGRRPGGAPAAAAAKRASGGSGRNDVAVVRQWARENGHTVPDRGRLKPEVFAAYDAANA